MTAAAMLLILDWLDVAPGYVGLVTVNALQMLRPAARSEHAFRFEMRAVIEVQLAGVGGVGRALVAQSQDEVGMGGGESGHVSERAIGGCARVALQVRMAERA